jgi:hypothetical protein
MTKSLRSLGLAGLAGVGALLLAGGPLRADAPPDNLLRIVSATYGQPGATRARDFSDRLQRTCGDHAVSCESFCSRDLVGTSSSWRLPFSAHPVCRVVYRCGEGVTRATETDGDELIMLNCKQEH